LEQQRVHVRVTGRVQGVYYRASTQEQAQAFGLVGWVRNLPNGDVEFEAQGLQTQIEALLQWAHNGPPRARVDDMTVTNISCRSDESGFEVQR